MRRTIIGLLAVAAVTAGLASGAGRAVNSIFPGSPFTFNDCCNNTGALTGTPSTASSYPSTINVSSGIPTVGHISVNVTLDAITPDDVQLLLVSPSNAKVMLMANVGGDNGNAITPDALVFDDAGAAVPDNSQLKDGTYHPTAATDAGDCDNQANPTNLPAPAPTGPYGSSLNTAFNGSVVSGQWKLYAVDDCNLGNVGGGVTAWSLSITGPTAVTVQSFTAKRASEVVRLGWRTGSEARIAGYNVYRFAHGTKVKVNRHFVAAKRSGTARGARYALVDRYAKRAAVTYRLQIVSLSGKRSWAAAAAISARG